MAARPRLTAFLSPPRGDPAHVPPPPPPPPQPQQQPPPPPQQQQQQPRQTTHHEHPGARRGRGRRRGGGGEGARGPSAGGRGWYDPRAMEDPWAALAGGVAEGPFQSELKRRRDAPEEESDALRRRLAEADVAGDADADAASASSHSDHEQAQAAEVAGQEYDPADWQLLPAPAQPQDST